MVETDSNLKNKLVDVTAIIMTNNEEKHIERCLLSIKDTILPIDIFTEKLSSAFGVNNNYCQNIKLSSDSDYAQGNYIDVNIDNDKCSWKKLGISWNNWLYSDLSKSIYGVYLEFDIKIDKFSSPKIFIEDYNGKKMAINLLKYIKAEKTNNWQKIKIQLKDFPIKKSEIDLKRIKNISFDFADKDKLKIDNIKLTN